MWRFFGRDKKCVQAYDVNVQSLTMDFATAFDFAVPPGSALEGRQQEAAPQWCTRTSPVWQLSRQRAMWWAEWWSCLRRRRRRKDRNKKRRPYVEWVNWLLANKGRGSLLEFLRSPEVVPEMMYPCKVRFITAVCN